MTGTLTLERVHARGIATATDWHWLPTTPTGISGTASCGARPGPALGWTWENAATDQALPDPACPHCTANLATA